MNCYLYIFEIFFTLEADPVSIPSNCVELFLNVSKSDLILSEDLQKAFYYNVSYVC